MDTFLESLDGENLSRWSLQQSTWITSKPPRSLRHSREHLRRHTPPRLTRWPGASLPARSLRRTCAYARARHHLPPSWAAWGLAWGERNRVTFIFPLSKDAIGARRTPRVTSRSVAKALPIVTDPCSTPKRFIFPYPPSLTQQLLPDPFQSSSSIAAPLSPRRSCSSACAFPVRSP